MDQEKEQEANQFAEQELIPRKAFAEFASQTPYSKAAIIAFAQLINLAPGVVVGQMQHKGLLPITHCNDLKVRYEWRAA
jgi:L-cystine uptake protein TcyP (sodium:dicarboxylate symporter family)